MSQVEKPPLSSLREFGDIYDAIERLPMPTFAVDREMTIRWLNEAARTLLGDCRGRRFNDVLEPASIGAAHQAFAQKIVGGMASTEYEVTLRTRDGGLVRADVSSVSVTDGKTIVGVFGLVTVDEQSSPQRSNDGEISLTPRQAEVLHLLARGCSTHQIAGELGVAPDTVRNHVKALLGRLGVHSRLEAVVEAHRRRLV
jgi:PAS domain S-box-containing protein